MRRTRPLREPSHLPVWGQLSLALTGFVAVSAAGYWPPVQAINVGIMRALHSALPLGSIDGIGLVLAVGSLQVSLVLLVGIGAWLFRRGERLTALSLALVLAAIALEVLLKSTLRHPGVWAEFSRGPGLYPFPEIAPAIGIELRSPFPSGHVMRTTYLALAAIAVFGRELTKWGALILRATAWGVVFLVAVGVLYLGWHWPTDVLGGLALALAFIAPTRTAMRRDTRGIPGYRLSRQPGRWANRN